MPKFIVTETYSGTRDVAVEAIDAEDAINQVRVGGGEEINRYEEPIAPYIVS